MNNNQVNYNNQINYQPTNNVQNTSLQQPTTPVNNMQNTPNTQYIEKTPKEKLRTFFIILIFVGLLITGISIYLLVDNNKKYNTYIPIAADLISMEKVYKSGIEYYQGTYKYVIDKKEYFHKSPKLYRQSPDKIIQIKYKEENPKELYDENASKIYFIILFSGIGLSFISMIIAISLSSSKLKEIITVQVIEHVTCVGGRRIYLSNININDTNQTQDNKYYVYFTNDLNKFALGNILTFNIYQYSEVFTTEKFKNTLARTIYNFKNDDFTLIESKNK